MRSLLLKACLVLLAYLQTASSVVLAEGELVNVYSASIARIPLHSEVDHEGNLVGGFVEIAKAVGAVIGPDKDLQLGLFPFARSIKRVEKGLSDFHIPLIRVPSISQNELGFAYVSEKITDVTFVLYTRANKPTIKLDSMSDYSIDTVRGHEQFFEFGVGEVDSVEQGIMKVVAGRTDGFIMEQEAVDQYLIRTKNKHIRRSLFAVWDSCIVIAKGERREELDNLLSSALRSLKSTGTLQEISRRIHKPYREWQPFEQF